VPRRIDEPGFVLHRYDWSESSLILEVFSRHHGRIALVAKGAKRPSSNFRPVLLPLQPLRLAFGGDAEIRTLKGAEWVGGQVMPTGDALLSGYYVNELVLRLLARDDPHPQAVRRLFGGRARPRLRARRCPAARPAGVRAAAAARDRPAAHAGRADHHAAGPAAGARYALVPEGGLVLAGAEQDRASLSGGQWQDLQRRWTTRRPSRPRCGPSPACRS
jgi:DNA repair protein RecO (recombination protein O)